MTTPTSSRILSTISDNACLLDVMCVVHGSWSAEATVHDGEFGMYGVANWSGQRLFYKFLAGVERVSLPLDGAPKVERRSGGGHGTAISAYRTG